MKNILKRTSIIIIAATTSLLLWSCDGDSDSGNNDNIDNDGPSNPDVLSSFELLVGVNNTGVGQPVGAYLLVIERSDGLLIKEELHDIQVLEESDSRIRFQYSGGPLANGVTGLFDADLLANTWTLVETPSGSNRDMSGSLEVLDFGSGHTH